MGNDRQTLFVSFSGENLRSIQRKGNTLYLPRNVICMTEIFRLEQARFLDPETISKWSDEYKLIDGDILVNSTGTGTVGRTRLFHSDILGDYPFVVPDSHVSVSEH